jgi:hypothetical protein
MRMNSLTKEGEVEITYANGKSFIGSVGVGREDYIRGTGYLIKFNREIYEGVFKDKKFTGDLTFLNGSIFRGKKNDGTMIGTM